MFPAFDRYSAYTDRSALDDFSARPLRKSIRVNTLKTSVERVVTHADEQGWKLTPVPWCAEGFYVDREDRSRALGRDLLHLLGHVYLQEAASMLPVALLDPQPGEEILDLCAAPGSKTTQIAARMKNTGVLCAADVQERRLWTLATALQRSGVLNTVMVKKVGQWFAKHMTERFDRVLCDAPCTAQGTVRKDSDALRYGGAENIAVMARLQTQLLESAIHATKVGGRIVYSTCTLTPEENEAVAAFILNKFVDQLEVVSPAEILPSWDSNAAQKDSSVVQSLSLSSTASLPLLRLWPQTYDTEGFFCAVFRKTAPTKHAEPMDRIAFFEKDVPTARAREIDRMLNEHYGTPFLRDGERLFQRPAANAAKGEQLVITTDAAATFGWPLRDFAIGLPFAKRFPGHDTTGRIRISHEMATLRGTDATTMTLTVDPSELAQLLAGQDIPCPVDLRGDVLLLQDGICIGRGLAKEGLLKNALPREVIAVSDGR